MRDEDVAIALADSELDAHRGHTVLMLIPALSRKLLETVYSWGARNCEIHFAHCRGDFQLPGGVVMTKFMPETA
jgi:hypothetical protein